MRIEILLATAVLVCTPVLAMEDVADNIDEGAAKAKACLACHNTRVSLKGLGAQVIVEQIKAIRAGEAVHPPGLAALNDADLAAIAIYLDGAD